jgi:hypothetical protein
MLQAADMLAYSDWQLIRHGDAEIYNALHVKGSRYRPEVLNVNEELIKSITNGAANWLAKRKEFGRRVSRT